MYGHFDCDTDILAFHEHRFVFFALPKVANSSIKLTLGPFIPVMEEMFRDRVDDGFATPFSRPEVRDMLRRRRILLCKHQLPRFRDYYSFAFVRNPWDRLVSCYVQKIAGRTFADGPAKRGTTRTLARAGRFHDNMTFTDFARAVSEIPDEAANRHFRSQSAFLTGRDGKLLVDEIAKFEEIDDAFPRIMERLGISGHTLPHLKKTQRRDFREYYDDATVEIVAKRYAEDIDRFGYTFV